MFSSVKLSLCIIVYIRSLKELAMLLIVWQPAAIKVDILLKIIGPRKIIMLTALYRFCLFYDFCLQLLAHSVFCFRTFVILDLMLQAFGIQVFCLQVFCPVRSFVLELLSQYNLCFQAFCILVFYLQVFCTYAILLGQARMSHNIHVFYIHSHKKSQPYF